MALSAGSRFGPYEVTSAIGAGGMGEVYRARDTKLNRDVALKVLPAEFALDAERLARFKREAQLLASLDHPNIGAIYGFEDSDGIHALVLQLVEGATLADRIAQGRIPVDEALPIARQIAEALEAAHENGVIHRDLKPANIKVTSDGRVKVLDFGLAKLLDVDQVASGQARAYSPHLTNSPTITTPAMTMAGVILGTAANMSPEQAKGRPADKRSDIWAFGCVLYEMLTGKRAFGGEDVSDTLAAVLRAEPRWDALPADTPPAVQMLIRRCLDRDHSRRVGDVAAVLFVVREPTLGGMAQSLQTLTSTSRSQIRSAVVAAFATAVLAIGLTSAAWWMGRPAARAPIITRFSFPLGEGEVFPDSPFRSIAISPDGTQIAYVFNRQLLLRSMSDSASKVLVADTGDFLGNPAFSPDGQSIVFYAGVQGFARAPGVLKRVAIASGLPATLCSTTGFVLGISWDRTGILFGQVGKGILRVSPEGGTPILIVAVNPREVAAWPSVLPGGDSVLFTLGMLPSAPGVDVPLSPATWDTARVEVQSLRSGQRKTLFDGGSDARYAPTGHLLYATGGDLFARRFDLKALEVIGGPVPILEGIARTGIARTATGAAQFSLSQTGSSIYLAGPTSAYSDRSQLVIVDRAGQRTPLKLPLAVYERPRVSPSGGQIAVSIDDGKASQIWIYDLAGTSPIRQLTFEGTNRFPVWAPDGQRVAFTSDREGDFGIFSQRSDGATRAERLTKAEGGTSHTPESWSRDGQRLVFTAIKGAPGSTANTLWILDLKSREVSSLDDVRSFRFISPDLSPDGRWVAYTISTPSPSGTANQVFAQPVPATGARFLVGSGSRPQWSPDGKELFLVDVNKTFVVRVKTLPSFTVSNPTELPFSVYGGRGPGYGRDTDIFPDGKRFVVALPSEDTTGAGRPRQMNVVLNWLQELKTQVPTK